MNLYPYQVAGIEWLRGRKRAYLADSMGLGKTVQALVALRDSPSITVICPAGVVGNWVREHARWGGGQPLEAISYASLHKLGTVGSAVVLDEAHYTKSPKAKRSKAALTLAAQADRSILLSGTPMPNHPGELWTYFRYIHPELLGDHNRTHHKWLHHYCKVRETRYGPKIYGHKNTDELVRLLHQVMLRRKLEDVSLDLPSLRVTSEVLPVKARSFEDMLAELGDDQMLAALEEEKDDPSTSRIRRLIGEWKAPHIATRLDEELKHGQYQKVVVLYHHRSVGDILAAKLQSHGLVRFDGRTKTADRQKFIDTFNRDPGTKVFLGQQMAAGEGLNLQAAHEAVLVEPAWTPDANRQAIKRIHRIGQDQPCRARVFSVAKTIDEAVMQAIADKTMIQEAVGLR